MASRKSKVQTPGARPMNSATSKLLTPTTRQTTLTKWMVIKPRSILRPPMITTLAMTSNIPMPPRRYVKYPVRPSTTNHR